MSAFAKVLNGVLHLQLPFFDAEHQLLAAQCLVVLRSLSKLVI